MVDTKIIESLQQRAGRIRRLILNTVHRAGCGHTGGSLSAVEILTVLYFHVMNIDPADPKKADRDRYVQSKGHATPAYYAALAERGFFPVEELETFDEVGSILQGHPCMKRVPGVDFSTGSLGQGLSGAIGMSLARDRLKLSFNVYCLLGDGECQEGQVWEAAMYAGVHKVSKLVAVVDYNKVQLAETVEHTLGLEPFADKWRAFGWQVAECDGHDVAALVETLERATRDASAGPIVVLAHTTKGKGVSFMENQYAWHGKAPDDKQFAQAVAELEAD
ncbi:MAG: transketolase [Planctomycetota bacterium]|nr:transketolase [Planctomycetota bacterium]